MKKIFLFVIYVLSQIHTVSSQDKKFELNLNADIYSLHLWRGFANGNAPSIQPCVELKKGGFTFGAWAAYAINGSYSEIDLYVNFQLKNLKFSIFDYFMPETNGKKNSFFDFKNKTTRHTFDLIAEYDAENFPIRILASNFIFGDDRHTLTSKNMYSTYLELAYKVNISGKKTEFIAALTPHESYYANKLNVIMAGVKVMDKIKINSDIQIPMKAFLMLNPYTESIYFNLGISL